MTRTTKNKLSPKMQLTETKTSQRFIIMIGDKFMADTLKPIWRNQWYIDRRPYLHKKPWKATWYTTSKQAKWVIREAVKDINQLLRNSRSIETRLTETQKRRLRKFRTELKQAKLKRVNIEVTATMSVSEWTIAV